MLLKLKESIRANGVQYLPPAVVDIEVIGITRADADVLVRRGTAEVYDGPTDGTIAGVVENDGTTKPLADMTKAELVALADAMDIVTAGKTKPELLAAIEAAQVS